MPFFPVASEMGLSSAVSSILFSSLVFPCGRSESYGLLSTVSAFFFYDAETRTGFFSLFPSLATDVDFGLPPGIEVAPPHCV